MVIKGHQFFGLNLNIIQIFFRNIYGIHYHIILFIHLNLRNILIDQILDKYVDKEFEVDVIFLIGLKCNLKFLIF